MSGEPIRRPGDRWRHRLFWPWIAGSIAVAILVGIAAPFADLFGAERRLVGIIVPPC